MKENLSPKDRLYHYDEIWGQYKDFCVNQLLPQIPSSNLPPVDDQLYARTITRIEFYQRNNETLRERQSAIKKIQRAGQKINWGAIIGGGIFAIGAGYYITHKFILKN